MLVGRKSVQSIKTEPFVPEDSLPEHVQEENQGGIGKPGFTWSKKTVKMKAGIIKKC